MMLANSSSIVHTTVQLENRLRRRLEQARETSHFYHRRIPRKAFEEQAGLVHFQDIPMVSKEEIIADQTSAPPFGGTLAVDARRLRRVYSSGGLYLPLTEADLAAVVGIYTKGWREMGVGTSDVVDVASTYHRALGGTILDESFRAVGATVFPGGPGGNTERVRLLHVLRTTVLQGFTPYVEHLAHVAAQDGYDTGKDFNLRLLIIGGELRDAASKHRLARLWGSAIAVEVYGTAEVGLVATECPEVADGMHVLEGVLVEIVDPDTGEPTDAGAGGEIVLTELYREAQPWIRYRTGDVVEGVRNELCACGRSTPRLGRIVGRRSSILRVRGSFVDPLVIAAIVAGAGRATTRSVHVRRDASLDEMTVEAIVPAGTVDDVCRAEKARIIEGIQQTVGLRCDVKLTHGEAQPEILIEDHRQGTSRPIPCPRTPYAAP